MNGPQTLELNPERLKFIPGIYLSPANKNLFIVLFISYLVLSYLILLKQNRTNKINFT